MSSAQNVNKNTESEAQYIGHDSTPNLTEYKHLPLVALDAALFLTSSRDE